MLLLAVRHVCFEASRFQVTAANDGDFALQAINRS